MSFKLVIYNLNEPKKPTGFCGLFPSSVFPCLDNAEYLLDFCEVDDSVRIKVVQRMYGDGVIGDIVVCYPLDNDSFFVDDDKIPTVDGQRAIFP